MKILFILEQIWIQVAKYSVFCSLNVNRVHPHVLYYDATSFST